MLFTQLTSLLGLQITTSTSILQLLLDAVISLIEYPYGCNEQTSSKLLVLVSMQDYLQSLKHPAIPDKSQLRKQVATALKTLKNRQDERGGYGYYSTDPASVFVSAHVANAIGLCQEKGHSMPGFTSGWLKKLDEYLQTAVPYMGVNRSAYAMSVAAYCYVIPFIFSNAYSISTLDTDYTNQRPSRRK